MKRVLSLLLMLLYVGSISGATFDMHYCGGSLQSVSFSGFGHTGCCCENKEMKNPESCCKDKVIVVKCGSEHNQIHSATIPLSFSQYLKFEATVLVNFFYPSQHTVIISDFHSPPIRAGSNELLILNSTFRI